MKNTNAAGDLAKERARGDWIDAYDVDTQAVLRAAMRRGIPIRPVDARPSLIELGNGAYLRRLSSITTSMTGHIGCEIARSKHLTNHLLRAAGVPVPVGEPAGTVEEAVAIAGRIGYPVVVKPVFGARARGVHVDLRTEARLREFFPLAEAEAHSQPVMVERFVPGRDYRVLVIDDQVVAVMERMAAFVTGDGMHTIRQLIDATNDDPRRGESESLPLYPIRVDVKTIDLLAQQGLTVDDIPPPDVHVTLKPTGSIRGGGAAVDRTDVIHPDNARIALLAAQVVGLDIAGIDLVTPDIAQSMLTLGGAVLEVNHGPGFNQHLFPAEGQVRDPGPFVVDMLFPPGQPVRAPIVAIPADPATPGACQLIAHILATAGKAVGLAAGECVMVDGLPLGNLQSGNPARTLLDNPAVEIAVIEVDARMAEASGSGFEYCDVAVLRSDLAADRALLGALDPRGVALVDAGDPTALALAKRADRETILFGIDARAAVFREHVTSGGRALALKQSSNGAALVAFSGGRSRTIWNEKRTPAPALQDGSMIPASLLLAAAASLACDIPVEAIGQALPTFRFAVPASVPVPASLPPAVDRPLYNAERRPKHPNPESPAMPELTIGMATYKDFDGVYFTIQALRLYQDVENVEFLVVDNYGCDDTRRFVTSIGGRYVRATDAVGSAAAKNVVFQEAQGRAVLCCDSHVLFPAGVIARLKDYHHAHPESRDLLQGPLVYDDLKTTSTHFDPVWRGQMWGIWASDARGDDPEGEPFEIPMQGMGAFSCRLAAWPGFNPAFRGFGGEEGYIHEKMRQTGGRCLCLPWFRWTHRFGRPGGVPYPLALRDKIRNYMIGFIELGLDLDPIYEHFAEFSTSEQLAEIYADALLSGISSPVTAEESARF